jgi:EAL domain-containing protein (putative c-di-GMP-specific phosphodiesterase class I)
VGIVQRALADSGLAPDRLELELSESLMMADIALTSQVLTDLRALGVHIAIDDFGTGYSSFAHLKRLPLDRLKIDQSFVNGLEDDEENQTITRTLIQLAHNLNMNVIAEGVETAFQLDFLKQHGCDEIQGYIFSKAHPAPIIEDMLHKQGIQAESTQGRANPA